nr:retrovirus-related Pol polyprotein from transposon TNT 1-94 [Tanacetum cinerariifolium]
MASVEVPQTLESRGDQLNVTPVLEVENFTNWKKRFMCHIIDDQMNSVMNCLTAKSTWYDLILYHEGLSDVKESRVMDLKLCYNTFKFKEGESLTQTFTRYKALMNDSPQRKPKLRPTKNFEAKYNKVKAKLTLLSSSALASKASTVKNKVLIAEAYEWDEKEVSSDDNEMVEVKVLMAIAKDNDAISKEGAINGEWVKISMRKVHALLEMEDNDNRKLYLDYLCIDLNYVEEQRRQKDIVFVKSLADDTKLTILGVERPWLSEAEGFILPNHDTVCSTPLPPLKKLDGAEPISGPKTIKSILRSKFVFKAEALKDVIISEPSSTFAEGNKSSLALKVHSAPADSGCLRHMTGVKSYLHKYVEQPGPKVVFGDDSTCTTEGYSSIKCNGIVFRKLAFVNGLKYNLISINQLCDAKYIVQFDEKRRTIFNSNKKVVMIAPRVRDVYVLDMTSSA